jgi:hypothetical protein
MCDVVVIPIGWIIVAEAVNEAVALACPNANAPKRENNMKLNKLFTAFFLFQ